MTGCSPARAGIEPAQCRLEIGHAETFVNLFMQLLALSPRPPKQSLMQQEQAITMTRMAQPEPESSPCIHCGGGECQEKQGYSVGLERATKRGSVVEVML